MHKNLKGEQEGKASPETKIKMLDAFKKTEKWEKKRNFQRYQRFTSIR